MHDSPRLGPCHLHSVLFLPGGAELNSFITAQQHKNSETAVQDFFQQLARPQCRAANVNKPGHNWTNLLNWMWWRGFPPLLSGMLESVQAGCQFGSLFVLTPNQPVTDSPECHFFCLFFCLLSFLTQSHGDHWPSRQWSWYGENQLMSSWTRSPNRHCNVSLALIQVSFQQPDLKLKDVFFFLFHYMKAVITKVLSCHRLHSAGVIMEDVITWLRRAAVIPRSGHKSEAEWFVAAGQSSCGKRQMWDSGSIWAKPHWCQQTDRRWRHIRDQQHPENSWSEPEGGADSRLAAASC